MIWEGRGRREEGGIENTLKVRQIGRETVQMTLVLGAGRLFARILRPQHLVESDS